MICDDLFRLVHSQPSEVPKRADPNLLNAEWNERAHAFAWTAQSFEKILAKCEPAMLKAA
jgi:hypothetical protein